MARKPFPTKFPPRTCLPLLTVASLGIHLTISTVSAQTFYSQGDPSPQEQFILEIVNRARANPPAEGVRLGRAGEFAGYGARPPLAFNAALSAAARVHNNDMAARNFFSHTGSDGSQPGDRAVAAGYPGSAFSAGENLSFGFPDPLKAVNFLMLDDGVPSLDHRRNFLDLYGGNTFYRETGIAFDTDSRAFNTQIFSTRGLGIITGVAFQDFNGDNFYTPGEGVGGITVSSPQSTFVTRTSGSGGFSLPMDNLRDFSAGVTVVFRDATGANYTRRLPVGSTFNDGIPDNVKTDLRVGQDAPDAPAAPDATVSVVGNPPRGGFVVTRQSADVSQRLEVIYHNGGSANRGVDYVAFSGTLSFGSGQSEALIPVTLLPGANRGKKVKVFLDPSPTGGYSIGKAQSKVFLSDLP